MAQAPATTLTQNVLRDGLVLPRTPDPAGYGRLTAELERVDRERGTNGNRVFYLATAPQFFSVIINRLGASGIAKAGEGWKRVVIEKPFGNDLKSAQALNQAIHSVF